MQELGASLAGNGTGAANATAAANASANATAVSGFSIDVHPLATPIQAFITGLTGISGTWADLATAAAIFLIFLVISEFARYFVKNVAPHMVRFTSSSLDDEILSAIKGPITVLFIVAGAYLAIKSLDNLSIGLIGTLDRLALAMLILVFAYFLSNLISGLLRWYARDVAPHTDSDLDDHLIPFMEKMIGVVVYLLAFLLILSTFGIEITALVASMGVAGIAVALAAQESLSNVFGAVAILMDRPYKVGDRLLIPGIGQGDVLDIGMRSTRVLTRNRQVVVIPNREMASTEIVNLSMPDSRLRLQLKVGVGYKADIDRACKIMEDIAAHNQYVAPEPKSAAYVSALGDFSVEITLLAWISDYRLDREAADEIYRQILIRFKEEDIEITYPVLTVMPRAG